MTEQTNKEIETGFNIIIKPISKKVLDIELKDYAIINKELEK